MAGRVSRSYSRGVSPSEASCARKALDITDGGSEHGAGEQSHTGYLPQLLHDRVCVRKAGNLPLGLVSQPLELIDVTEHLLQKRTDRCRQIPPRLSQMLGDVQGGHSRPEGDCDVELAQQSPEGVEVTLACAHPLAAQSMQGQQLLLLERLYRHCLDIGATCGLHQCCRVGTIGLVTPNVLVHVLRGQQLTRLQL
jgi:hypothetical protein